MSERAVGRATVPAISDAYLQPVDELQYATSAAFSRQDLQLHVVVVEKALVSYAQEAQFRYLAQLHRESQTAAAIAAADYERAKSALDVLCDAWESLAIERRQVRRQRDTAGPQVGWLYQQDYSYLAGTTFEIGIATGRLVTQVEHVLDLIDSLRRLIIDLEQMIHSRCGQHGRAWYRQLTLPRS